MLRRPDEARGSGFIDIGVVKEAGLELAEEDPFHGPVQRLHAHAAFLHGFPEQGETVRSEVHVHAGFQRQFARLLLGCGDPVVPGNAVDALQVADYESLEVPLVVQDAGQELFVASGRDAVQGIV